jgi:hypothetical protein
MTLPKTKFILDFISRVNGQSITTVVERAVRAAGKTAKLKGGLGGDLGWEDFWDPEEGIRLLKLLDCKAYQSSFDEEELKAFVLAHRVFFYSNYVNSIFNVAYLRVLWPKLDEYRLLWREEKENDYWIAGKAMAADLAAAQIRPPVWPPPPKPKTDD